jgi:prolyl oligopeptidase
MPIVPEFQLDIAAWLALGGVYAVANIRGGGEFGAPWHEAGKGARKQNVFDDFIAAAEYLLAQRIAKPGHLAIRGLSNGGLLTGACLTQRPDLFGAVISELPLLDPLRMGRDHWSAQIAPELGNPTEDPAAFDTIARYSPLQNLRAGVVYPPTLVVAADKDAQLLMDGARKFIATLQSLDSTGGPHLLHIVRGAAHGGWSKSQQIETASRELAFLAQVFGMTAAPAALGD